MGFGGEPAETTVTGMTCGNCQAHVKHAVESAGGRKVAVDLETGRVTWMQRKDIADAVATAVRAAGYDVASFTGPTDRSRQGS